MKQLILTLLFSFACGAEAVATDVPQYLVVDLVKGGTTTYASVGDLPEGGLTNDVYRTTKLVLRRISAKGKSFQMGSSNWEIGHDCLPDAGREGWNDGGVERPLEVLLSHDFYLGVYPVTQRQYELVTGKNPSRYKTEGATRPVESASFLELRGTTDATKRDVAETSFLGLLRAKAGGRLFDLPTEAQWEFACRAGTTSAFNNGTSLTGSGNQDPNASRVGRHHGNGGKTSSIQYWQDDVGPDAASPKVGSYEPNAWGLYDMHGGVWEFCLDGCGPKAFLPRPGEDGHAHDPVSLVGGEKALRGGSFGSAPAWCRSAMRWHAGPNAVHCTYGVRVCLTEEVTSVVKEDVVPQKKVKVGYYVGRGGRGNWGLSWLRLLTHSPEIEMTMLDGADVRAGKLDTVEVLVMPGGRSAWEAKSMGEEGMEKVRNWLRRGGKYYGTCAGLSLLQDLPGLMRVVPFAKKSTVRRGDALMKVEFTKRAEELTGITAGTHIVSYYSGPVLQQTDPKNVPDCHDVEILATFAGSIQMNADPEPFPMQGIPAFLTAGYGKGRIFATATHPEYFPATQDLITGGFKLLTGQTVTFDFPRKPRGSLRLGYFSPGIMERTCYESAAQLDALPHVDYRAVDDEIANEGGFDHCDVLVIPDGDRPLLESYMTPMMRALFDRFARKGGQIFAWGDAARYLPATNARSFATSDELISAVARIAGDPDPASRRLCVMPDQDRIDLPGEYGGHLQDVWRDGTNLFWTHTEDILRTDLQGKILAQTTTPGLHAAGCETRDGKLYVAMCDMGKWGRQGATPGDPLQVSVFNATTLKLVDEKFLDANDYAGSFCFRTDGSCIVGCLRAKDMAEDEVRFHHFDRDFKHLGAHVVKNLKVPMGIEVVRSHGDFLFLAIYPGKESGVKRGIVVKLDKNFKEVARYDANGTTGMVFDGPHVWMGGVAWPGRGRARAFLSRMADVPLDFVSP